MANCPLRFSQISKAVLPNKHVGRKANPAMQLHIERRPLTYFLNLLFQIFQPSNFKFDMFFTFASGIAPDCLLPKSCVQAEATNQRTKQPTKTCYIIHEPLGSHTRLLDSYIGYITTSNTSPQGFIIPQLELRLSPTEVWKRKNFPKTDTVKEW